MIKKIIKVRCINNDKYEEYLTINKIYDAISFRGYYKILNNKLDGGYSIFVQEIFMTLAEYRNQQIDNILK